MAFSFEEIVGPAKEHGFANEVTVKTATGFDVAMSRGDMDLICHSDLICNRNFARLQFGTLIVSRLEGASTCEPDAYRAWLSEKLRVCECDRGRV